MILTGHEIKTRLGVDININPFNEDQLNTNSYDVLLNNELLVYSDKVPLDCRLKNETMLIKIPQHGLILQPGLLYLGSTVEYTETNVFVPRIEGKSSLGRLGLSIHKTAGFGDIGFRGCWTLEISCVHPLIIYPSMRIAQLYYYTVFGSCNDTYQGKYQDSKSVIPSQSWKDFNNKS